MANAHEARHTPKDRLTHSHHRMRRAHAAVHEAAAQAAAEHYALPVLAPLPDSAEGAAQTAPEEKGTS